MAKYRVLIFKTTEATETHYMDSKDEALGFVSGWNRGERKKQIGHVAILDPTWRGAANAPALTAKDRQADVAKKNTIFIG